MLSSIYYYFIYYTESHILPGLYECETLLSHNKRRIHAERVREQDATKDICTWKAEGNRRLT